MKKVMCFSLLIGIIFMRCSKDGSLNPEPMLKNPNSVEKRFNKVFIGEKIYGYFTHKSSIVRGTYQEVSFSADIHIKEFEMGKDNIPYCIVSLNSMTGYYSLPSNIKSLEDKPFRVRFSILESNPDSNNEITLHISDPQSINNYVMGYLIEWELAELKLGDELEERALIGDIIAEIWDYYYSAGLYGNIEIINRLNRALEVGGVME